MEKGEHSATLHVISIIPFLPIFVFPILLHSPINYILLSITFVLQDEIFFIESCLCIISHIEIETPMLAISSDSCHKSRIYNIKIMRQKTFQDCLFISFQDCPFIFFLKDSIFLLFFPLRVCVNWFNSCSGLGWRNSFLEYVTKRKWHCSIGILGVDREKRDFYLGNLWQCQHKRAGRNRIDLWMQAMYQIST